MFFCERSLGKTKILLTERGIEEARQGSSMLWIGVKNKTAVKERVDPGVCSVDENNHLHVMMEDRGLPHIFSEIIILMGSNIEDRHLIVKLYTRFMVSDTDSVITILYDLGAIKVLWGILIFLTHEALCSSEFLLIAYCRRIPFLEAKAMVNSMAVNCIFYIMNSLSLELNVPVNEVLNNCVDSSQQWCESTLGDFIVQKLALRAHKRRAISNAGFGRFQTQYY